MVYTANCDIYVAVHEKGINDLISQVMLELPSFFNIGSPAVASNPQLACNGIDGDPIDPDDPLISSIALPYVPPIVDQSTITLPAPLFPANSGNPQTVPFSLYLPIPSPNYLVQLSQLQVDFYPGNTISIPSSSVPSPLKHQHFLFHAQTYLGASCPNEKRSSKGEASGPGVSLDCFSLNLYVEGALRNPHSARFLNAHLDGVDLAGIKPDGLRHLIDCYLQYFANNVLSSLSNTVNLLLLDVKNGIDPLALLPPSMQSMFQGGPTSFLLQAWPSTSVPNNPAIEDDQLKLFIDADVQLNSEVVGLPGGLGTPGSGQGASASKTQVPRPTTGPLDFTLAISQDIINKIFGTLLTPGSIEVEVPSPTTPGGTQPKGTYGNQSAAPGVWFQYQVAASLTGGTVTLQNPTTAQPNGSIYVKDVTVTWDTLKFWININLPQISVPGIHTPALVVDGVTIIPAVNIGGFTLFGAGNPITIPVDLSGIASQASIVLEPVLYLASGTPSKWELYVVPQLPIFVVPAELTPALISAITNGIENFFDGLFSGYPQPLQSVITDLLNAALTLIGGAITTILTDATQFAETIVDDIVNSNALGLTTLLDNALYNYLTSGPPIFSIPDPVSLSVPNPINNPLSLPVGNLGSVTGVIGPPVINLQVPLPYLGVSINSSEVVLEGDVGPPP